MLPPNLPPNLPSIRNKNRLSGRLGGRLSAGDCEDVLQNERAEYGKEIVQTLSAQLTQEFGRGFGRQNLFQMLRFAEVFPDEQIAQTLSAQLSWSHFVELIPLDDQLKREFYAEMCRVERWSVRTLERSHAAPQERASAVRTHKTTQHHSTQPNGTHGHG
jgi:hypothetical protein